MNQPGDLLDKDFFRKKSSARLVGTFFISVLKNLICLVVIVATIPARLLIIVIILINYLYGSDRFATHNISSNPIIITQIMSLTPTANSLLKCIFTLSDAMVS